MPADAVTVTQKTRRKRRRPADVEPEYLPVPDAARLVGVSRSLFYRDILPHVRTVRIGRRGCVVSRADLLGWMRKREQAGAAR